MKVYWTLEARARLLEIQTYIAQESPMVAHDVAARLLRRSRDLSMAPMIGRRLPEYPRAMLYEILERPFRIIYVVKPERVEVVTIKHYRQNLPANPGRLMRR